ncbi:MAG: lipase family protein [Acidimicrobiia bacterium]
MTRLPEFPQRRPFSQRHPIVILVVLILMATVVSVTVVTVWRQVDINRRQDALQPFYTPPSPLPPGVPGQLLRSEPFDSGVPGTRAWRVLYRSEDAAGNTTVSSGMVFAPSAPPTSSGYPVMAWAHGTVGMGNACAPSRSANPMGQLTWLNTMIANGWVVAATDYSGLGTPGTLRYLVGQDAARDVINSARAARNLVPTSNRLMVYGHSQGGASSLWTGEIVGTYAPELQLVAVAAAAPAAELGPLLDQQWNNGVGWAIGAEVLRAWPMTYPELSANQVTSKVGQRNYARVANECILDAALEGLARQYAGQQIFRSNPNGEPQWANRVAENTPPPFPATVPVLVIQGLADTIVLPNTTTLLAQRWCSAGSNLTTAWLGDQGHMTLGKVGGPLATTWLQQRLAGIPATSTCGTTLPVAPYQRTN